MFALLILVVGFLLGIFVAPEYWNKGVEMVRAKTGIKQLAPLMVGGRLFVPYRQGLDIQGGTHLVYQADLSNIAGPDQASSLEALRDVIERRVNLFGVAEPVVQLERAGADERLVVELAGVRDVATAIQMIGTTPFLEFKKELPREEGDTIIASVLGEEGKGITAEQICTNGEAHAIFLLQSGGQDPCYQVTGLTGRFVKRADIQFGQTVLKPEVSLELNDEGAKLFADLTKENVGKRIAIYLDGTPISIPVVQEEITGGRAQITGSFSADEAKELAGRLNAGALPVPIKLISQESVEASLGKESLMRSLYAGLMGVVLVAVFMILWYRLPGMLAVTALLLYIAISLAVFKLIPVTLTIAGIAGFILSIGMAVDANILIFERMKEELQQGKGMGEAIREGFSRAWTSIRDSNVSSMITAAILYWLGKSSVQGFALTLFIGIVVSMFSAIIVTRTFLFAVRGRLLDRARFLFLSGWAR